MRARSSARLRSVTTSRLPEPLRRPFRIIAFDWDGTAVVDRRVDATPARRRIERLLELGVVVVVITGTNFQNVDRQLTAAMRPHGREHLFVCTNRGSEVFGFGADRQPHLLWRRVASPEEDRALTAIADETRDELARRWGLRVAIVYDRLNRRKIDLIPEPGWEDPPKSELANLYAAVEKRLTGAGITGGLHDVIALVLRISAARGLPDARLTSDAKHVEVGLTDKGDSIRWVMTEVAARRGIPSSDVLIAGDEFAPLGGFPGSDAHMAVPEAQGAVFVSVGVEPTGVPDWVIHLPGGPPRFLALLDAQCRVSSRTRPDRVSHAI